MPSLVLEGGTFRPIFSCGIMDALLEEEVMFPYCIGVSAGISNGVSYVSKQLRRNYTIAMKYRNDKRYLSLSNYRKCKSMFGLDFVFGEIPDKLVPFDWETYRQYEGKFIVGLTNVETGLAEYKDGKAMDAKFTMLRATCALPLYFPMIELDGKKYYDGGIADPIPIRKAIKDGNQKHLIVLTRTAQYRKVLSKQNILAARFLRRRYPKLAEDLLSRHIQYNKTVQYCEKLEKEGKAIILRPQTEINSFEKDTRTLKKIYQTGYHMAKDRMDEIKDLF